MEVHSNRLLNYALQESTPRPSPRYCSRFYEGTIVNPSRCTTAGGVEAKEPSFHCQSSFLDTHTDSQQINSVRGRSDAALTGEAPPTAFLSPMTVPHATTTCTHATSSSFAQHEEQATSPRSPPLLRGNPPLHLTVSDSRGATFVTPAELRQEIQSSTASDDNPAPLKTQVVQHTRIPSPEPINTRRKYINPQSINRGDASVGLPIVQYSRVPSQASRPALLGRMGNQHSHHAGVYNASQQHTLAANCRPSHDYNGYSTTGHHPNAGRQPPHAALTRGFAGMLPSKKHNNVQGSTNRKKEKNQRGLQSPLPEDFTATVIEVPRAATAPDLDLATEEDIDLQYRKENDRVRHKKTFSAPPAGLPTPPGSPATITGDSIARPLSAGSTITPPSLTGSVHDDDRSWHAASPRRGVSALSPTLPTPSPLPEDSPHKYGLRDHAETPEPSEPFPDLEINKAKRRSSGLEIFNACP